MRVVVTTWEGANKALAVLREGARQKALRNTDAEQRIAEIQAERDEAVAPLDTQEKAVTKALEGFVADHREDLGEAKTRELTNGILGFRLGQPKVQTLNKRWTTERVIEAIQAKAGRFRRFVRSKVTLDKEAVLTAVRAERPLVKEDELALIGLAIKQSERFVCEPKLEEARTGAGQ